MCASAGVPAFMTILGICMEVCMRACESMLWSNMMFP